MINPTALELVDTLCDNASKEWCDLIHALHETAHAEGVAAERERARVESEKRYGSIVANHNIYGSDFNVRNETCWCCTAPPDEVLAPTKEMTEGKAEAQHGMVEEFTKDIDKIMIDAINFRPDKERP